MPSNVAILLGVIGGLACAILSVIFITPQKKRETLPPFLRFLHDLFNFKFLIIEKILKFLYIFFTGYVIVGGFFMLFAFQETLFGLGERTSLAIPGLLMMIVGPFVVRILYELMMMFILIVKNVIELNNKTKNQNGDLEKDGGFGSFSFSDYKSPASQPVPGAPYAPQGAVQQPYMPQGAPVAQQPYAAQGQPAAQQPYAAQAQQAAPQEMPGQQSAPQESSYVFCSQCGQKYSAELSECPACKTPKQG